jgi:hypothetical protein
MQNREELRQKGPDGSRETTCREKGKKYYFWKGGGGINFVFGPKYRPLDAHETGLALLLHSSGQLERKLLKEYFRGYGNDLHN